MADELLNQGNDFKSMTKRPKESKGAIPRLAGTGKKYYNKSGGGDPGSDLHGSGG
jgi:hypothetical protein